MSAPDATIRDSAWKPMSYIAPSPPITHSRRSGWPAWSQRAPDAQRDGRRVLEQRVRPRDEVRVERVGAAEDRVAAGRRDDAHRLRAVHLAGRGDQHPDRGRLAAAGARAGAADVAEGVLAEHQVGQRLLVAILGRRRRERAEERACRGAYARRRCARRRLAGDLVDHDQRVVAERRAHVDALARSPCSGPGRRTGRTRRLEAAARRDVAVLRSSWAKCARAVAVATAGSGSRGGERRRCRVGERGSG